MRYQMHVKRGLRLPSGRVIAIGRYMLASLLLFALWFDASPAFTPLGGPFAVNSSYVIFALIILVITWNNWWLDARLAGPTHAVDILVFTTLVFSTQGFDSPYFTFFMFVLLSAAIRWGWRATALTAVRTSAFVAAFAAFRTVRLPAFKLSYGDLLGLGASASLQ